jgi:alkylmercury lyase
VKLYRLLAEGSPVPPARLATDLNLPVETVSEVLSRYAAFTDDQGAIVGFGGLTVAEMPPHQFRVTDKTLYTWCAWDSLFIPSILGNVAEVTSRDPVSHTSISLTVTPDGVKDVYPPSTVVSFLAPDRTFDRDAIANFCHFVHFFGSRETGDVWTAKHPGTFLLSVNEAFRLGQLTNARNFRDALSPRCCQ